MLYFPIFQRSIRSYCFNKSYATQHQRKLKNKNRNYFYENYCFHEFLVITCLAGQATLTISASLNQTSHGQWFVWWFPTRGITYFFTDTQNTTERVEEKNKQTNMNLGQLQVQEGGSLCDTFVQLSVHLQAIAGMYFVQNFHKVIRNADSSLDCLASIFWLCPSLDSYLKPTVLFCLPLSTALSVFSGTFFPSSTSGHMGDLALRPFVQVLCQNRQRDSLTGANTNGNECYLLCHILNE